MTLPASSGMMIKLLQCTSGHQNLADSGISASICNCNRRAHPHLTTFLFIMTALTIIAHCTVTKKCRYVLSLIVYQLSQTYTQLQVKEQTDATWEIFWQAICKRCLHQLAQNMCTLICKSSEGCRTFFSFSTSVVLHNSTEHSSTLMTWPHCTAGHMTGSGLLVMWATMYFSRHSLQK